MRALTVSVAGASLLAVIAAVTLIGAQLRGNVAGGREIHGLRFGMSKEEARRQFRDSALGSWRSADTSEYELLLWEENANRAASTHGATFVFHQGLLTAIRLVLDEQVASEQIATLPSTESVELTIKHNSSGAVLTYTLRWCNLSDNAAGATKLRWAEIAAQRADAPSLRVP